MLTQYFCRHPFFYASCSESMSQLMNSERLNTNPVLLHVLYYTPYRAIYIPTAYRFARFGSEHKFIQTLISHPLSTLANLLFW